MTPANQAENEEQTTFMNKKVEDFGLFCAKKVKNHHTSRTKPKMNNKQRL